MKRGMVILSGTLALAGMIAGAKAGGSGRPCCPPCAPQYSTTPGEQAPGTQTPDSSVAADQFANNDYSDIGSTLTDFLSSNITVAGTGLTSATAANGAAAGQTISVSNGLISPGLLTAANAQSPLPVNRIFFNYAFYDAFQVVTTTNIVTTVPPNSTLTNPNTSRGPGFNLNRFDVGFEKTIFGNVGSVYVQAPFVFAANNITTQAIDGIGDLNVGVKFLLLFNRETGSALSAGMTVACPTARSGQFVSQQSYDFGNNTGPSTGVTNTSFISVNPTFLQPWTAFLLSGDRFFVQEYFGVLIPVPSQIVTSINNNVAVGYRWYQNASPNELISSITPILNAQTLIPLSPGATPLPISFPTQVFLTEGLQIGLGNRVAVFGGFMHPVAGPGAFNGGGTFGANIFF